MCIMLDVDYIYPGLLNVIVYWHTMHLTLLKFNFYYLLYHGVKRYPDKHVSEGLSLLPGP